MSFFSKSRLRVSSLAGAATCALLAACGPTPEQRARVAACDAAAAGAFHTLTTEATAWSEGDHTRFLSYMATNNTDFAATYNVASDMHTRLAADGPLPTNINDMLERTRTAFFAARNAYAEDHPETARNVRLVAFTRNYVMEGGDFVLDADGYRQQQAHLVELYEREGEPRGDTTQTYAHELDRSISELRLADGSYMPADYVDLLNMELAIVYSDSQSLYDAAAPNAPTLFSALNAPGLSTVNHAPILNLYLGDFWVRRSADLGRFESAPVDFGSALVEPYTRRNPGLGISGMLASVGFETPAGDVVRGPSSGFGQPDNFDTITRTRRNCVAGVAGYTP